MALLKSNIQELELALSREREFNSSDTRINAEYLVNVLKKFLMTDNKSERSRLAIAITQILHMHPEECGRIADKWAPQLAPGRGLVGWLLPPRKTTTATATAATAPSATASGRVKSGSGSTGDAGDVEPAKTAPVLDEIDYLTDLERYR